ncbi:MAG: NADH-quinone oxidoreductase subunit NuoF [Candidatus Dasytiphilus stammeri]
MKKKNNFYPVAETHPLTWRMREDKQPVWIQEYCRKNGYTAAKKTLLKISADEVVNLVKQSGLKGRGGSGFPTGIKWSLMPAPEDSIKIRYFICNADEMEPGTYKDRILLENLPHLLIEGMIISAYALKATIGYIFLRGEYIIAAGNIRRAIYECREAGFLGKNIMGSGFNFQIILHTGAGRYICGEETALMNAIEGKRANPRSKPPFPANSGLWKKPTCINNVETICNIPSIMENGVSWYKGLAINHSYDMGTKLLGFSGRVKNPGIWELPLGIYAREVLENYAGDMMKGFKLKAWQPGGSSTAFLTPHHLDLPLDFTTLSKVGSRLGTGIALAVDDKINMVELLYNLEKFFSRESCGWCTPCREGLPWTVEILRTLKKGQGQEEDLKMLEKICALLEAGKCFCYLAPGAIEPLRSSLKYFQNEFEQGIVCLTN